jgi:glycosyltransferase involved in cell wall biosynthesis
MRENRMEGGVRVQKNYWRSVPGSPLVSIITVVFNGERYLEQTILSVINQTCKNIEYIVIDGGSTDGTLDIINKYDGRIDYWVSEPDSGIYDAMNKGIRLARGEIIGIINSDDYYIDNAVEKIVETAGREPEAWVFHADMRFEKANGMSETWRSKETLSRSDFYHMPINHPTAFVRAACYEKYGVFDTRYKVAADYDLVVRYLFDCNVKFRYVKETLVVMREGGISCNYSMTTYNNGIEILSKRDFPLITKMKFRVWYLWRLFMKFSKRFTLVRHLSFLYNRVTFAERE